MNDITHTLKEVVHNKVQGDCNHPMCWFRPDGREMAGEKIDTETNNKNREKADVALKRCSSPICKLRHRKKKEFILTREKDDATVNPKPRCSSPKCWLKHAKHKFKSLYHKYFAAKDRQIRSLLSKRMNGCGSPMCWFRGKRTKLLKRKLNEMDPDVSRREAVKKRYIDQVIGEMLEQNGSHIDRERA